MPDILKPVAVSYTHLDVYKRQIKNKMAYEVLEMQRFVTSHGLDRYRSNPHFPMNTLLVMRGMVAAQQRGQCNGAVSYTHLDVYKRQLLV